MRISTALKCSKLLRSFGSQNPNSQACFLHLATEKPSLLHPPKTDRPSFSSPIITQIVNILKTNDNGSWKENDQLAELLSSSSHSLSSDHFYQITRRLGDSSTAFNFIEHLRSNSSCPDANSLSVLFEAIFELASRETNRGEKLLNLLNASKELNVPLTVYSATLLIGGFGNERMVDKSMMVYEELDPQMRNSRVRNVLIDELLKSGRLDDALKVLDEMLQPNAEFPPDKNTGEIVFLALLKGERYNRRLPYEEVVKLVSRFGSHGVFPDSLRLRQLITKFCRTKRIDSAWDILHVVMESSGPVGVASCNALLAGLGKHNEFKKMNLLMEEMKKKGILPNVVTFNISINHLCKSRRIDQALDLFEKMKEGKLGVAIEPDVIMYNTVIDGLCKVGRIEEGKAFMQKMIAESKLSPSTATYNCVINGLCKAGQLETSLELFHEMSKEGVQPNVITLNSLVDGMCKHGKAGKALRFYREMIEKGLDGNTITYTALIGGFCAVNNFNKALELIGEMKEKCRPDAVVYYTLISGFSQSGRTDMAESVLSEMRSAGFQPDLCCYNVLINGFCKNDWLEKALALLQEMEEGGVDPDIITYNTLISYFGKVGDLRMAKELLKRMLKDNIAPTVVTYGTLIRACSSAGEVDEAMKIFQQMKLSTTVPPNTVIYNTLINSLCQNKNVKAALSLLDEMKSKEVPLDTSTFNSLFKGLHEENWVEKALELMDRMVEEACDPDYRTLEVLTEWLSVLGKADQLRQFLLGYKVSASTA